MIQALNQKTSERMRKRKMTNSFHGIRPPQLEQPGVQTLRLSSRACSGLLDIPSEPGTRARAFLTDTRAGGS